MEHIAEQRLDRLGTALLAAVGIAASILNLAVVREMATAAGWSSSISWLAWLILDLYALTAMRTALIAPTRKVRLWAGFSTVFALVISAGAAGSHVAIRDGHLPAALAVAVLCLPAIQLGLSFHLLLLSREGERHHNRTQDTDMPRTEVHAVSMSTELEVTDTVTHQRQISRRSGTKTAQLQATLAQLPLHDQRSNTRLAEDLAAQHGLSRPTASKAVAEWRPVRRADR